MFRRLALVCAIAALAAAGCAPSLPSVVQVKVTDDGFEPAKVHVRKGQPAVLVITRESEETCATDVVFTETGRKFALPLHQPVRIDLPTDAHGTLHYACGMDMVHGEISVD